MYAKDTSMTITCSVSPCIQTYCFLLEIFFRGHVSNYMELGRLVFHFRVLSLI